MVGGIGLEPMTLPACRDALPSALDQFANRTRGLPRLDLQFPLGSNGLICELLHMDDFPRTATASRGCLSGVVFRQPAIKVVGMASVEATTCFGLENVDRPHEVRKVGGIGLEPTTPSV